VFPKDYQRALKNASLKSKTPTENRNEVITEEKKIQDIEDILAKDGIIDKTKYGYSLKYICSFVYVCVKSSDVSKTITKI
ncbi:hypothetical protein AVEN_186359-1, partial [Araneus ventricosus]